MNTQTKTNNDENDDLILQFNFGGVGQMAFVGTESNREEFEEMQKYHMDNGNQFNSEFVSEVSDMLKREVKRKMKYQSKLKRMKDTNSEFII
jgi:hypothetical protein